MKIIKKISVFLFILLLSIVFINKPPVVIGGLEEDLISKQASLLGCGYPNTEANQCCLKSTTTNIEEEDLNRVISKLKSCTINDTNKLNQCITNQEAEIVLTLLNTEKNDQSRGLYAEFLARYLESTTENKETQFSEFEQYLRNNAEKYNNLPRNEKLKVQIRNSITKDKCFISGGPIKGFCTVSIAGYFADVFGNDPNSQTLFESEKDITIDKCIYGDPIEGNDGSCICKAETGLSVLCVDYITDTQEYNRCAECNESKKGFWTGLGCINLSFSGFVQETLFGWALGLAGIITLLCIIYAAFMLQTSAGNPERVKKARQYLTSCIVGLVLIIFSILILRIIGVDILKIPGFS